MKKLYTPILLLAAALLISSTFGCKKPHNQPEPVEVVEEKTVKIINPNIELVKHADLVIDVRRADEFQQGHLNGAVNIPHDDIESRLGEISSYRNKLVVLYCRSGRRASLARTQLLANGFTKVDNAGAYYDLLTPETEEEEEEAVVEAELGETE